MANGRTTGPYVLGLDLGVASIGWALIGLNDRGEPDRMIRAGVHLFEAGAVGNVEEGKDESPAKPRRDARQIRRQTWRRANRKRHLLKLLQKHGLLPAGDLSSPATIDEYIKALDDELKRTWESQADHRARQLLPYRLRAEAIRRRLEPKEVGRALYHLAQRRGFLSNRKSPRENDEGEVKKGIAELDALMRAAGAETLGEFFASLDPTDSKARRIRGRWTSRTMYEHEFERIWTEQSHHHPEIMTDAARAEIHEAIFYQRPLKSQSHLIGTCELTGERRAPIAHRLAQKFRVLQKVNDVAINLPDGRKEPLTEKQRDRVRQELLLHHEVKFTTLRNKRVLGLPRGLTLNLEEGGEKKLAGHRTDAKLRAIFDGRWDDMDDEDRDRVVEDLMSFEKPEALARRGRRYWALSGEQAEALGELRLEEGYSRHSLKALRELVPLMERGVPYMTARKERFPESLKAKEPVDVLPPLVDTTFEVRSPTVIRALTELRKLINAVIRRYGRPVRIHIELARDLKKSRKHREQISERNRKKEKERERAKQRIFDELGYQNPSRIDIEKVLLADECDWHCPFTGRGFGMRDLLGQHPLVDIEHIWPFSRSLDNTFLNKTLCLNEENRARKRNRTPWEAYHGTADRYEEILQRVAAFKGDAARTKLERFRAEEIPEGFSERHLQESRYISRQAAEYLALLYGGLWDESGTRRIQVSSGGLTAWLRREWHLNAILNPDDEDTKSRCDHRHHAIDAIVIGIASPAHVQYLARAAEQSDAQGSRRLFAGVQEPWVNFLEQAREAVEAIIVSHRQHKKVSGALHAETLYSKRHRDKADGHHRIRKELHKLTASEVASDQIIDARVRRAVQEKLAELGEKNPAKAFADPTNHPCLTARNGRQIAIHKVRLQSNVKPWIVGTDKARQRFVTSTKGSNHHTVIMAKLDAQGNEKTWVDQPVTLFEAYARRKRRAGGEAVNVFSCEAPPGHEFKFTLAINDFVRMHRADGDGPDIYRVLNVSKNDIEVILHTDGRTQQERRAAGERERVRGSSLSARRARKVHITYLGEVKNAGG